MEVNSKIKKQIDDILVIEKLLPASFENEIVSRVINNSNFPWFMIEKIGHNYYLDEKINYTNKLVSDGAGFYHSVVEFGKPNSIHFDFFRSVLFFLEDLLDIEIKDIIRIRLRYTHQVSGHSDKKYAPPHVDFEEFQGSYKTLIYYVNDSDGDTVLFDKIFDGTKEIYDPNGPNNLKEVLRYTPTKGHAILFNGHRYHSGNFPLQSNFRIMINFDFTENN